MAFNLLFPTPVWDVEPDDENEKLISEIQKEVSSCITKIKSDKDYGSLSDFSDCDELGTVGNWRESNDKQFSLFADRNVIKDYKLENLQEHIKSKVEKFINTLQWTYLEDPDSKRMRGKEPNTYDIELYNSWVNITRRGLLNYHRHPHFQISGCYYHKISPGMGSIEFKCPNTVVANGGFPNGPHTPERISLMPKEGSLILFPSWLEHAIGINETNEERISLSFNIKIH